MRENLDKVVARGEQLSNLEEKTAELEFDAGAFRGRATALHRTMWWQSLRLKLLIGAGVLVVIFIAVWIGCGIDFHRCAPQPAPDASPSPS
jgi:hypothetical protein